MSVAYRLHRLRSTEIPPLRATKFLAQRNHFLNFSNPKSFAIRNSSTRLLPSRPECPSPTCQCQEMPPNLDIDREKPLDGTMATYAEQVVIHTGRSDWASRIEDDENLPIVKKLKEELGRNGRYSNPFHNVMVTTSSSPSNNATRDDDAASHTVSLFPSYTTIPSVTLANLDTFIRGHVLPTKLSPHIPASSHATLLRSASATSLLPCTPITKPHIQICGHNARDTRCGTLGPILLAEFKDKLAHPTHALHGNPLENFESDLGAPVNAEVSLISHIGGHKFAGNVIIYIPRKEVEGFEAHPLAGKGVWYGRVEPRHVEGIVMETVRMGVVIKELFRGAIGEGGEMLRL